MGYFYLALTIAFESAAVIFMKLSNGMTNKWQTGTAFICYALSFVFLSMALKQLPAGTSNAIWAGGSTIIVTILGWLIFKEQFNAWQLLFLGLIVIGMVGLQISGTTE
ncbi:MAG: hypothetical protein JWQ27_920 [Ferruginibacter sp.]|nr:hypothetical protein [Ferruginibacter sp.]